MYSILQVFPVFPLASISFHQPKPPKKGTNVEHLFYALELTLTSVLAIASVSHQGWLDILEHSNFYLSKSDRFLNWSWFVMVCHDLLDYNMIYIYAYIYTMLSHTCCEYAYSSCTWALSHPRLPTFSSSVGGDAKLELGTWPTGKGTEGAPAELDGTGMAVDDVIKKMKMG
jgi:hypothetical protein